MSTNTSRYNSIAMILHWLMAFFIIAMLVIGKIMVDLPNTDPDKFAYYQAHKSVGLTILVLTLLRIVWRVMHKSPALPADMPRWEQIAAKSTQGILYLMMIALPLTGWAVASTSTSGIPTMWFGLFEVPSLPGLASVADAQDIAKETHETLGNITILLLLLHVAAALKHHFWDKDDVLKSMIPFLR
jgi:cytochrome b561